jgi:hypothetical protein
MSDACVICRKAMEYTVEDGYLIDVCNACTAALLDSAPPLPARCTVCHTNPVCPEDGQDTCDECLAGQCLSSPRRTP